MRQFVLKLRDLLLKLTFDVVGHPYSVAESGIALFRERWKNLKLHYTRRNAHRFRQDGGSLFPVF
jgi:hypothetical protein